MPALRAYTFDSNIISYLRAGNGVRTWDHNAQKKNVHRRTQTGKAWQKFRAYWTSLLGRSIIADDGNGAMFVARNPSPPVDVDFRSDQGEFDFAEPRSTAVILPFPVKEPIPNYRPASHPIASALSPNARAWLQTGRRISLLAIATTTLFGAGLSAILVVDAHIRAPGLEREFKQLVEQQAGVQIVDAAGKAWGQLPRYRDQGLIANRTTDVNIDIFRAMAALESDGVIYGVSPLHLVNSGLCFGWEGLWHGATTAMRQCAGGSTLLMQASTSLRGGKAGRAVGPRKITEVRDAMGQSINMPKNSPQRMAFILDGLRYGNAGKAIIGAESASRILFGMPSTQLTLGKAVIIATLPKRQIELTCTANPSKESLDSAYARWQQIRDRAEYALSKAFANDPRYGAALREIQTMKPILRPSELARPNMPNLNRHDACLTAASPIYATKFEDNGLVKRIEAELLEMPSANVLTAVTTATKLEQQREFKIKVQSAMASISSEQQGHWLTPPSATQIDVLLFATEDDGSISALYNSNARDLLNTRRRLGSLSKIVALLAFAKAGYQADTKLCDRSYRGLRNAGGGKGYSDCTNQKALVSLEEVIARSLNLPIRDGLAGLPSGIVEEAAQTVGFRAPKGQSLVDALAFGTAEARPVDIAAALSAISRGLSGRPAIGVIPHAVRQMHSAGTWRDVASKKVDLTGYFASQSAADLLRIAGAAPLVHQRGTLRQLGSGTPARNGEIAKSGTDAREELSTFGIFAAGAWRGRSWFSMVAAPSGPLGDGKIKSIQLSNVVRSASLEKAD